MNPDITRDWVADLRSGRYEQGHSCLTKIVNGMSLDCCLGVQCKLYMERHPEHRHEVDQRTNHMTYFIMGGILPEQIQKWSEMATPEGTIRHPFMYDVSVARGSLLEAGIALDDWDAIQKSGQHDYYQLTDLNDSGLTFDQIADVIEFFADEL